MARVSPVRALLMGVVVWAAVGACSGSIEMASALAGGSTAGSGGGGGGSGGAEAAGGADACECAPHAPEVVEEPCSVMLTSTDDSEPHPYARHTYPGAKLADLYGVRAFGPILNTSAPTDTTGIKFAERPLLVGDGTVSARCNAATDTIRFVR